MDKTRIEEYHATRDFSNKGFRSSCYAPHVSMYFDTLGNVLACCQNSKYPMGNVTKERLPEIWHGERAGKLRRALQKDSFGAGCQFCEWQISVGNYVNAFTRNFDSYPVADPNPEWPQMMEFSVSNTCNLECVMCYGVLSSSIRARREGLPPLPKVYDDQFFEDLRPFLHHLKFAKFLGGEPFLAAESFRVWDLMHEENVSFPCNVTTNGTQWNERVEQVLERFPISICVSMDGATKQTVEGIRVNAHFEKVHENFRRFHAYCKARGTPLVLTYCLMPQNWHEFGDYLLFAEEWDCDVGVNLVYEPAHCSLYTLPTPELDRIATSLEKQSELILPQLKRNRQVWLEQVTAIRRRVEHATDSARSPFQTPLSLVVLNKADLQIENKSIEEATERLRQAVGTDAAIVRFASDKDDRIESIGGVETFFDLPVQDCEGRPFPEVVDMLASKHGTLRVVPIYVSYDFIDRCLLFQRPSGELWGIRQISVPRTNEFGMTSGSMAVAASFTIAPHSLSHDESKIRSMLSQWSGGVVIETMLLDAAGKLTEVPVGGDHLEGLPEHLTVGMNDAEIMLACRRTWGLPENVRSLVTSDFEDHTYRFDRKSDLLYLRSITIPRFDSTGAHIGYQRFVAVARLQASRMEEIENRVRQQLADWAGHDRYLRISCNRGDEAIAVEGPQAGLLGLDEASCLGKTQEQILNELAQRFGPRTNTFFEQGLEVRDTIDTYRTSSGHISIRSMALPRFNSAGHHVGTVRYLSGLKVGRCEALNIEREATKTLDEWSGHAPRMILIEAADGKIERAAYPQGDFYGLDVKELIGNDPNQLQARICEKFGDMTFRYYVSKATALDMILDYSRPGSLLLVRAIRFPHVDIDGYCLGQITMLAGRHFDARSSAQNEARIRDELTAWDAQAEVYRFVESRQHKLLSIQGPATLFGITLADYKGRSFEELAAEAARQVGSQQITRWQQTAEGVDLTAELTGDHQKTSLRCATFPCVLESGEAGYVHLLAIKETTQVEGNLMERLERIAAELKEWAHSNQFMCVVEDEFARILEVDADVTDFMGVEIAKLPSRGMPSVTAEFEDRYGAPTLRREVQRPGEIDVALYYQPRGALVSVRSIMLPSPLHDRTVGAIRLVVARQFLPGELAEEIERAKAVLRDWSGSDEVLSFVSDPAQQNVSWIGPAEAWHGIHAGEVDGKPMADLHQLLVSRFGAVDFQVTNLQPAWDDIAVTFRGAERIWRARCLALPYLNAEGNHVGRLQLFAMAADPAANGHAKAPATAAAT